MGAAAASSGGAPREGSFAQRIETAAKTGRLRLVRAKELERAAEFPAVLKSIDGADIGLQGALPIVLSTPRLQTLKLNDNPMLTEVPIESLLPLVNLKSLDLSRTGISHIVLSPLVKLTHVNLSHCRLAGELGHPILALPPSLVELDLSGNKGVVGLSVSFGFEALPVLELVDLSETAIGELPETMGQLAHLTCLRLERTPLKSIPATIFQNTPLARLDLKGSNISKASFLELAGVDAFLARRQVRLDRDVAGGMANIDTSMCGLD